MSYPGRSAGGRRRLRAERSVLTGRQKAAEGGVSPTQAKLGRHPKAERRGSSEAESRRVEGGQGIREAAGAALGQPGEEAVTGTRGEDAPGEGRALRERVREAPHLQRALQQVRRHPGAAGIDGRTVEDLEAHLKAHGPTIRAALVGGVLGAAARTAQGDPEAGGWNPPPGDFDRPRPGPRASPVAGPAGGRGPPML